MKQDGKNLIKLSFLVKKKIRNNWENLHLRCLENLYLNFNEFKVKWINLGKLGLKESNDFSKIRTLKFLSRFFL